MITHALVMHWPTFLADTCTKRLNFLSLFIKFIKLWEKDLSFYCHGAQIFNELSSNIQQTLRDRDFVQPKNTFFIILTFKDT